MRFIFIGMLLFLSLFSYANPYWDPNKVPKDRSSLAQELITLKTSSKQNLIEALRIQVVWLEEGERYLVDQMTIETSGTPALLARSRHRPRWGSYLGILKDKRGKAIYYDAIGTGKEYRKLARAINLRFPLPTENVDFELYGENPQTGVMEKVAEQAINLNELAHDKTQFPHLEIKELLLAKAFPSLRVNIYAEGYALKDKSKFWQQALKAARALQEAKFPGVELARSGDLEQNSGKIRAIPGLLVHSPYSQNGLSTSP
ncbi:M64 family metallopeptidase [Legionella sp. km772]|uniref:M64 family metallopeptidase n=1 Tax=Legionella sp. km772 TaxID=2498111 RepID=UPI000F8D54F9|nr:M64 family metallopeptidase [Legionella sp. km772]RUR05693.1 hypothetical protein ELY15_14005 [Legionella sp. km772]